MLISVDESVNHASASEYVAKQQFIRTTLNALETMTPQEAAAWVNDNVTDLASAKDLLRRMAAVLVFLWQERDG